MALEAILMSEEAPWPHGGTGRKVSGAKIRANRATLITWMLTKEFDDMMGYEDKMEEFEPKPGPEPWRPLASLYDNPATYVSAGERAGSWTIYCILTKFCQI